MASRTAQRTTSPVDTVLIGVGVVAVLSGLVFAVMNYPANFLFLPLDLLTLLTVAGGALLVVAGLVGRTAYDSLLILVWVVLVVVSALVATIVTLGLNIL